MQTVMQYRRHNKPARRSQLGHLLIGTRRGALGDASSRRVVSPGDYLLDESRNYLTDESGNYLIG